MPHEKINHPRHYKVAALAPDYDETGTAKEQLVVSWNEIGWVQVAIYPEGWSHTGEASIVDLNPQELDLLLKTLRRAKRQAYGKGRRHDGFEDGPKVSTRPLFPPKPDQTPA